MKVRFIKNVPFGFVMSETNLFVSAEQFVGRVGTVLREEDDFALVQFEAGNLWIPWETSSGITLEVIGQVV